MMQRLRCFGIHFTLDDSGAGMVSPGHRRNLPLDDVTSDKAVVWRVKGDPSSRMTVKFIVRLGHELGRETIGEGVEDLRFRYISLISA